MPWKDQGKEEVLKFLSFPNPAATFYFQDPLPHVVREDDKEEIEGVLVRKTASLAGPVFVSDFEVEVFPLK